MTKHGFIVMGILALGGAAGVHRTPLLANEPSPGPAEKGAAIEGARPQMEWLARELKLTDAQVQQLEALHKDLERQAADIRENNLLPPSDKEARMHALFEGLGTRIKALLNSDQIQKFDQMGGLKGMMGHGPIVGGMRVIGPNGFEALNLTEAQKAAIETITAQEKQAFAAAGGDVTKLKAQKQATWQRIMAILTPEQQRKMAAGKGLELEREPGGDSGGPDLSSLGLTPEQHERLTSIMDQGAPRAHAIQENPSLSEEAKHAQLTALYEEFRPRILSVLTPAQEQKFRALLFDRHGEPHVVPDGKELEGK